MNLPIKYINIFIFVNVSLDVILMLKISYFVCDINFVNIYTCKRVLFNIHGNMNQSKSLIYLNIARGNGVKFANKGQALGSEKLNGLAMSMTYECSPMSICHVNDEIVRRSFLLIQSHMNFLHAHAIRIQCMNFCARIS